MKHRYTAKIYFEDGQLLENVSDDLKQLTKWIFDQVEASYNDVTAEIFDNRAHRIIRSIQYSPPTE